MAGRRTEDLRTGIEIIDRQHKVFRKLTGTLCRVKPNSEDDTSVAQALEFVRRYAAAHFAMEEELMGEYKYRYRNYHTTAHRRFRNGLENLGIQLRQGEADHVSATLPAMVVTWLTKHIEVEDQRLAAFLNEKAKTDEGLLARLKALARQLSLGG